MFNFSGVINYIIEIFSGVIFILVVIFFFLFVFFFVLIERKLLGVCQSRLGPQKVSFLGLLQSLADFIKLLGKINSTFGAKGVTKYRYIFYWLGVLYFFLSAIFFLSLFIKSFMTTGLCSFGICWFIVFSSLSGYGFLLCGWGSTSKYSLYGTMRAGFSGISFEGVLMCVVLALGLIVGSYSFYSLNNGYSLSILGILVLYLLSIIGAMCECNRSPFDFSESESDLVSGFNTDYYGASFAILFACEYAIMVFFCWLLSYFFWGSGLNILVMFVHSFILIFVRACFPRIRYDYFVSLVWKGLYVLFFFLSLISLLC
uniref:NADH-ubiquinone oxidoreductase chain 1 n=1 Tax=Heterobothrium okamotoi TaxID=263722 RepID=A0A7U0M8A2_9PLAT|nr:NADH dehydrogenase subunit 1 [Heterobothrium okamotoi]QQX28228.1 NADH dehydrogenase subunit 1 [Heterobothrium okamotoi]